MQNVGFLMTWPIYAVVTHYNHTAKTILMSTKIYDDFLFFSSFLNEMKEKNCHIFSSSEPKAHKVSFKYIGRSGVRKHFQTGISPQPVGQS